MWERDLTAKLTAKSLVGISFKSESEESIICRQQARDPPLLYKPSSMSPDVQNRTSVAHKKDQCHSKIT